MNKYDSASSRKINEIDVYQQTRNQDFLALSSCSKGDLDNNKYETFLLGKLRGDEKRSQADIRSVLSTSISKSKEKDKNITFEDNSIPNDKRIMEIDSVKYLKINNTYRISLHENIIHHDSLLDRGANRGVCRSDITIIGYTN